MKKLTLLFILMFAASIGAVAKSVVFKLTNNKKVYYLLGGETNPMIRFADGKMTVDADTYEFSGIKNFYISDTDDPNSIESAMDASHMEYRANTLVVKASEVKAVKVYSVGGQQVNADIQKSDDIIMVNLNGLEKGIYVVNVGDASFKVMKK